MVQYDQPGVLHYRRAITFRCAWDGLFTFHFEAASFADSADPADWLSATG